MRKLVALLLLLLWTLPASADERAELQELAKRLRKPAGPAALADVLAASRLVGAVPAADALALLTPAAQAWRQQERLRWTPPARFLADLLAQLAERSRDPPALAHWHEAAGVITAWSWLGPFGAEHGSAFARVSGVEAEAARVAAGQPRLSWPGRVAQVQWQPLPAGLVGPTGRLLAEEWVEQPDDAVIFLQSWLRIDAGLAAPGEALTVQWEVAVVGAARIYLDGVLLADLPERTEPVGLAADVPALPGLLLPPMRVAPGRHRLLVKLAPSQGSLPVRIRARDAEGRPLALRQEAMLPDPAPPPSPAQLAAPLAPGATPAARDAPAADDGADDGADVAADGGTLGLPWPVEEAPHGLPPGRSPLSALLGLAWHSWPVPAGVLQWLVALLPEEVPPDDASALAHALLANEPGDRIDRLRVWAELRPQSVAILVAEAAALDGVGKAAEAHRLWQDWSARHKQPPELVSVRACVQRVTLWQRLAGDAAASALLQQCAQRWPDAPDLLAARARDAESRDDLATLAAVLAHWQQREPGRLDVQAQLLNALIAGDRLAEARALAEAMTRQFPERARAWEALARHELEAGNPQQALRDLARLPPHLFQARTLELQARALRRAGEADAAVVALKSAVERAPARTDLRWRLAQWQPDGEFYAPYRRDLVALVRAEHDARREHAVEERLNQVVVQAVGNGQEARYEALVRYFGPGCDASDTVEVDYAPTLTRADILTALVVHADGRIEPCSNQETDQFGEDASGMYFDLERITLRFNGLQPGDAVIVEHMERDLAPTPFGLVFGELMTLADVRPVRETDIAILLPADTPVRAQAVDPRLGQPPLPQPQKRRIVAQKGHDAGAWDEWRLRLGPQAAIASERNMPGTTDVLPYLHVSTFASWAELAAWYRQLAAESVPARGADPVVHAEALRLTQGLQTDDEKIRALYAFATTQVRYVGLEFGIHSLKPHAVREVLQRAFGDCKDKATLLVALLAEVGIDAEVALVRTMDNGALHDGVASLGVFNHAIAYVPKYDLWLDATATHYGIHELPEADSHALALRVGVHSGPVAPQTLPDGTPRSHRQEVKQELRLQADGSVRVDLDFAMQGRSAADARSQLWVDASRREQLEQFLAARFPGVALDDVAVEGIQPLADTVRLRVKAHAPDWARRLPGQGWTIQPLRPSQPYMQLFGLQPGRKQPLVLAHPTELAHTTWLLPPPGHGVARQPAALEESWRGQDGRVLGRFALHTEATRDGALLLRTELVLEPRVVPLAELPGLQRFLATVDAALKLDVPLRPLETGR